MSELQQRKDHALKLGNAEGVFESVAGCSALAACTVCVHTAQEGQ